MKVVVNWAVGTSFCLSTKAVERLFARKSRKGEGICVSSAEPRSTVEQRTAEWIRKLGRNDVDLVQVVEELGLEAAGSQSELIVIEINDQASWHISDVVGYEFVVADGKIH